jgi:shikimate dehydrogenase
MNHNSAKLYGLIGYPLGHSFSVPYFTQKFEVEGINATYRNFPVESIDLFRRLVDQEFGLSGLNVTVPYKQEVIPFLDELDKVSKAIGAVNTIAFRRAGKELNLVGYNTDVIGFERSLKGHLESGHSKALILGTGGSSKAVCYVLQSMGIEYKWISRNKGNALITYEELTPSLIKEHTLIINTTPLGMYPKVDACPHIKYEAITSAHLLFDLVYNPEKTLFLEKGEKQGASIVNGFDMLVYQAEASWEIWNKEGQGMHL